MSAHDLTNALYRQGITLPANRISNWRTGRSLPRRGSTLETVAAIERLLRIPEGELVAPLRSDLQTEQASALSVPVLPKSDSQRPINDDYYINYHFGGMDNRSEDWDGEVYRDVMEEEIRISPDYRELTAGVSLVVRYGTNPNPTLHVSYFWESPWVPDEDDIGIYNITGMTVGKTVSKDCSDGIAKTTTLYLPSDLPEGELRQVYYEHKMRSDKPLTESVTRGFSWLIKIYTARVIFEGNPPPSVRWDYGVTKENGVERVIHSRKLELLDNTVQTTFENIRNATGVFRWSLPPGIE